MAGTQHSGGGNPPSGTDTTLAYRQAMGEFAAPPRANPADAFNAARRRIVAGEKLDMVALADELGVARGTLYRWTGDRDRLLADVITAELLGLIAAAVRRAEGRGVDRLEQGVGWFLDTLAGLPALRAFLRGEGASGLQMLTSPIGAVRPRVVATVTALIDDEVAEGHYHPRRRQRYSPTGSSRSPSATCTTVATRR